MNTIISASQSQTMTSKQIAVVVEKRHDNVKRTIEKTCKNAGFFKSNFGLTVEINKLGNVNRKTKHYQITRDGFSLLAMGFNGEDAMDWKIQYIEAFNQMADMLQFKNNDLFLQLARAETAYQAASEQASFHGRGLRLQGQIIKPALRNGIHELIKQIQPELLGLEEVA
jgi:Rha family phage regulatory protein